MEAWVKGRTDITPPTRKVYLAYISMFRKVYGDRDPKSDTVSNVKYYLEKLGISSRTKMYNILSKYTGNKEYSKAISPLLRAEEPRQKDNKRVLEIEPKELKKKIETIKEPSIRIVYMLLADFPFVALNNYREIRIGNQTEEVSYISTNWDKVVFNIKSKFGTVIHTEYPLSQKYTKLQKHFDKKSVLITRSLPALVMAIKNQNKIFGIPLGASIFKNIPKLVKPKVSPKLVKSNLRITIPETPQIQPRRRAETSRKQNKRNPRTHSV